MYSIYNKYVTGGVLHITPKHISIGKPYCSFFNADSIFRCTGNRVPQGDSHFNHESLAAPHPDPHLYAWHVDARSLCLSNGRSLRGHIVCSVNMTQRQRKNEKGSKQTLHLTELVTLNCVLPHAQTFARNIKKLRQCSALRRNYENSDRDEVPLYYISCPVIRTV